MVGGHRVEVGCMLEESQDDNEVKSRGTWGGLGKEGRGGGTEGGLGEVKAA